MISILLPAYNAEETVRLAVGSILRQTVADFDIIAVDDGSTDSTAAILKELASADPRVRLLRFPHAGLISALNAGIDQCRGAYIVRMDADDVSHPDRLKLQKEYMDSHPEVSVCGCLVRSFPRSRVKGGFIKYEEWLNSLVAHEEIVRDIFVESPFAHPSVMMRANDLRAIGGYREMGWPEDYDLWLRLWEAGKLFGKVPRVLFYWREWERRLTFTDCRYSLENFMRIKAHFLARACCTGVWDGRMGESRVPSRPVIIWGAGMTGRRLTKHLLREGIRPVAVVDIDPKKIGGHTRGIPIIPPDELESLADAFIITAVGSSEARELIRQRLISFGRTEIRDFICAS